MGAKGIKLGSRDKQATHCLRTVRTFAKITAHMFCASRDGPRNMGFLTVVPAKMNIVLRALHV